MRADFAPAPKPQVISPAAHCQAHSWAARLAAKQVAGRQQAVRRISAVQRLPQLQCLPNVNGGMLKQDTPMQVRCMGICTLPKNPQHGCLGANDDASAMGATQWITFLWQDYTK